MRVIIAVMGTCIAHVNITMRCSGNSELIKDRPSPTSCMKIQRMVLFCEYRTPRGVLNTEAAWLFWPGYSGLGLPPRKNDALGPTTAIILLSVSPWIRAGLHDRRPAASR